jgi:hypothetical protein
LTFRFGSVGELLEHVCPLNSECPIPETYHSQSAAEGDTSVQVLVVLVGIEKVALWMSSRRDTAESQTSQHPGNRAGIGLHRLPKLV